MHNTPYNNDDRDTSSGRSSYNKSDDTAVVVGGDTTIINNEPEQDTAIIRIMTRIVTVGIGKTPASSNYQGRRLL